MIKRGKSTLISATNNPENIIKSDDILLQIVGAKLRKRMMRRLASNSEIRLNPDDFLYIRNRSISADETWGANQNWDAFPSAELLNAYGTFVDVPLDIDHDPSLIIGSVLDSYMIPKAVLKKSELKVESGKNTPKLSAFTSYEDLDTGDQIVGDWVENVWAINREDLESIYPHACEAILDGAITDTSMGTDISFSRCSFCGNKAYEPSDYCVHIGAFGVNKGTYYPHPVTGHKIPAYEQCYGMTFFEDSLIMPEDWNGSPGSQGADVSAKILQILASRGESSNSDTLKFAAHLRSIYKMMPEERRAQFMKLLEDI